MNKVKEAIAQLIPGQVPVIKEGQPIYALVKQVQWHWHALYDDNKINMLSCLVVCT